MANFDSMTIGVNSETINQYLADIKSEAIKAAQDKLREAQDELFQVFRTNWQGQAEKNFETNMEAATEEVISSLDLHYNTLSAKIYAIHNAWISQDEQMVTTVGGGN